ncbi:hypothetical protein [Paraburkholderia domus]|jgi:hypothetical protein|uniref:Uncharacterized protein n=1 Tax=Paraburkholderia domus TaxID=2793075 RepID=A0A9N8N9J7_9BURK|nr:hypothetical protein [Paraburkholderia domus]MBK5169978.1 hypothetical protein [Burkholderia sp. R-70211]CAE6968170.1 hypothetical protein R70211_07565 [Paraburkholderia domus]
MTTHLKFRIGEKWICMEDGNGYAPDHPDHVTFAVRDVKANGKPGCRGAANFSVRRRTVLDRLLADRPLNFARHAYASAERLRARKPVLRATQRVLEHCDDETAAGPRPPTRPAGSPRSRSSD